MTRAGREPTEDVKQRFVTACQEVGLEVQNANMIRDRDNGSRVILFGAMPEDWPLDTPMLTLMATVAADGDWTREVDVRCVATDDDTHPGNAPWMQGRGAVPLGDLVQQLRETLAEREEVMTAVKQGIPGPYEFDRTAWKTVDLLGDLDLIGEGQ